jgi:chromosome segregation ATPase
MTELQKLARAVASAREVAHHAKLELAAANAQATALTAAAKQAKAALKAARKQAKAAKQAAKSAKAQVATTAQTFEKAAKKALKLERAFGKLKHQRQPTKGTASASGPKSKSRLAGQRPKLVKRAAPKLPAPLESLAAPQTADPATAPTATQPS